MKYIYLLTLLIISNALHAQTISLNELIKVHQLTKVIDFEDILLEKGYEVNTKLKNELHIDHSYEVYGFKNKHYTIAKIQKSKTSILTIANTNKIDDYKKFKKELSENGFEYLTTYNNSVIHFYEHRNGLNGALYIESKSGINETNNYVLFIFDKENSNEVINLVSNM